MILAGAPAYCAGEANRLSCRLDELIRVLSELGLRDEHDGWLLTIAAIGAAIAFLSLLVAAAGLLVGLLGAGGSVAAAWAAVRTSRSASDQAEKTARAERRRANEARGQVRADRAERYAVRVDDAVANAAAALDGFMMQTSDTLLAGQGTPRATAAYTMLISSRSTVVTRLGVLRMIARRSDVRPTQLAVNGFAMATKDLVVPMESQALLDLVRVTNAIAQALTLWRRGDDTEELALEILIAVSKDGTSAVLPQVRPESWDGTED